MLKIYITLCTALFINVAALPAAQLLLLVNSDFENGSNPPDGWALREWSTPQGQAKIELSPGAHTGKYCAKVSHVSGGDNLLISQKVDVKGQVPLRLSYYCKTDTKVNVYHQVSCSFMSYDADGKQLQYENKNAEVTSDWTLVVYEFLTNPKTEQVFIYLRNDKVPTWYDDISLEIVQGINIRQTYVWYADQELIADIDIAGLENPAGNILELSLKNSKTKKTLAKIILPVNVNKAGQAAISPVLKLGNVNAGDYLLEASINNGKRKIASAQQTVSWPTSKTWLAKEFPKTKYLNNFVSELFSINSTAISSTREFEFVNPRDGWIYISALLSNRKADFVLDPDTQNITLVNFLDSESSFETMRYLKAGSHKIKFLCGVDTPSVLNAISVRTMPEIIMTEYESILGHQFRSVYNEILKNANVTMENFLRCYQKDKMATDSIPAEHKSRINSWQQGGRRAICIGEIPEMPGYPDYGLKIKDVCQYWSTSAGMLFLDGLALDEFGHETAELVPYFVDAVKTINSKSIFDGKTIYAYCPVGWGTHEQTDLFRQVLQSKGHKFAPEIYMPEQSDPTQAKKYILNWAGYWLGQWEKRAPGSMANTILVLSCTTNYYGQNCFPDADYRVFLDMQMNYFANDPLYFNVAGVTAWILRYADDQTVSWLAKLYRHYCIEGKKTLLSDEYGLKYNLTYIKNPDFQDGLENWKFDPADSNSIVAGHINNYGFSRGTCSVSPNGDYFAVLNQQPQKNICISQPVTGLKPGSLYSVSLYCADYNDILSGKVAEKKLALNIALDGVEWLEDKTLVNTYKSGHVLKPNFSEGAYYTYIFKVFRAKSAQSVLRISDQSVSSQAKQIMLNCIEIQPWL